MGTHPEGGGSEEGAGTGQVYSHLLVGEKRRPLPRARDWFGGQPSETRSKMRKPYVSWAELCLLFQIYMLKS